MHPSSLPFKRNWSSEYVNPIQSVSFKVDIVDAEWPKLHTIAIRVNKHPTKIMVGLKNGKKKLWGNSNSLYFT